MNMRYFYVYSPSTAMSFCGNRRGKYKFLDDVE